MNPRVAVLISTYNGEAFLAAQLDSLLMLQQWDAVEAILHEIEHWNQAVLTMLFESAR